jgi:hypothetical protein
MKRLADWQMVLGVNLVNQHVGHMSLDGVRKFDYPPMFTRAASWWENYHVLNDYIARICTVMSLGEQVNDILVLEPTTTAWLYNNYMGKPAEGASLEIGQKFQDLVATLEHAQVEFDLGCEHIFQTNGSVRDGKFVVGNRAYSTFVIPDGKYRRRYFRPAQIVRCPGREADRLRLSVAGGRCRFSRSRSVL